MHIGLEMQYFFHFRLTVEQAVPLMEELIEDETELISGDVCMQPPIDGNQSAGDSDDEDQPASLSHLHRNQLSAEATVSIKTQSSVSANIDDDDEDREDEIQEPLPKRARTSPPERNWEHRDLVPNIDNNRNAIDNNRKEYNSITEIDFLKYFLTKKCVLIFVSAQKNTQSSKVTLLFS